MHRFTNLGDNERHQLHATRKQQFTRLLTHGRLGKNRVHPGGTQHAFERGTKQHADRTTFDECRENIADHGGHLRDAVAAPSS
jgi:hypothetical protein